MMIQSHWCDAVRRKRLARQTPALQLGSFSSRPQPIRTPNPPSSLPFSSHLSCIRGRAKASSRHPSLPLLCPEELCSASNSIFLLPPEQSFDLDAASVSSSSSFEPPPPPPQADSQKHLN